MYVSDSLLTVIVKQKQSKIGWLISCSSEMALSGMYPSLNLMKSIRALRVGDPVVLEKQEWGSKTS